MCLPQVRSERIKSQAKMFLFAQWSFKCDIDCGLCGSYGLNISKRIVWLPDCKLETSTDTHATCRCLWMCVGPSLLACACMFDRNQVQICGRNEHLMILSTHSTYSITPKILHFIIIFTYIFLARHSHELIRGVEYYLFIRWQIKDGAVDPQYFT